MDTESFANVLRDRVDLLIDAGSQTDETDTAAADFRGANVTAVRDMINPEDDTISQYFDVVTQDGRVFTVKVTENTVEALGLPR